MIWLRQSIFCLAAVLAVATAHAQNPPTLPDETPASAPSQTIIPVQIAPPILSPVTYFRSLLAMTPQERATSLTNRPPQIRVRILAKVQEYQSLSPDERELRLRASELRWYIMPLLQMAPTNRPANLARIPQDLRDIVKIRLLEWDTLPPPLKQEFLENDRTMYYFVHVTPPANSADNLADEQRQKISAQFSRFLELTPAEKADTLETLSAAERVQMQKTLQSFEQLPPQQQSQCINNYAKFAGMSAAERAEFLKNAERWSQMSPAERQTWRDLVAHVPEWPPLPPYLFPPGFVRSSPPDVPRANVATNVN